MARNYIVEIGDEKGKSCKFSITTKGLNDIGSWRTIDKGYITQNSGVATFCASNGTLLGTHLQLSGGDNMYGIQLNDWTYFSLLTNSQGTGHMSGAWALGLSKGRISWVVVS